MVEMENQSKNKEILFYVGIMILFAVTVIYFANAMVARELIKTNTSAKEFLGLVDNMNQNQVSELKKN